MNEKYRLFYCTLTHNIFFSIFLLLLLLFWFGVLVETIRYVAESLVQMFVHCRESYHRDESLSLCDVSSVYWNHTDICAAAATATACKAWTETQNLQQQAWCIVINFKLFSYAFNLLMHWHRQENGWNDEKRDESGPWNVVQIFGNYPDWSVGCASMFSYVSPIVLHQNSVVFFCCINFSVFTYAWINVKMHAFHRNHSHGKGHFRLDISWLLFLFAILWTHRHTHTRTQTRQTR